MASAANLDNITSPIIIKDYSNTPLKATGDKMKYNFSK